MKSVAINEGEVKLDSHIKRYNSLCGKIESKEDTLEENIRNASHFIKNIFPREEIWRFFIEGTRQNEGKLIIDSYRIIDNRLKEQGSTLSFLNTPIGVLFKKLELLENKTERNLVEELELEGLAKFKEVFNSSYSKRVSKLIAHTLTVEQLGQLDIGWHPFEKTEPGYLTPLIKNFLIVFDSKTAETVEHLKTLRGKVAEGVKTEEGKEFKTKSEFRGIRNYGYSLTEGNATLAGIKQLLRKIVSGHPTCPEFQLSIHGCRLGTISQAWIKNVFKSKQTITKLKFMTTVNTDEILTSLSRKILEEIKEGNHQIRLNSAIVSGGVKERLTKIMNEYKAEFNKTISKPHLKPIEKLRCILKFIRNAEQLHAFHDGNCRTLCMIEVNRLLMTHGLPCCIFKDPNCFECYSLDELVQEAIEGMSNTLSVVEGKKDLFGITTEAVLAQESVLSRCSEEEKRNKSNVRSLLGLETTLVDAAAPKESIPLSELSISSKKR